MLHLFRSVLNFTTDTGQSILWSGRKEFMWVLEQTAESFLSSASSEQMTEMNSGDAVMRWNKKRDEGWREGAREVKQERRWRQKACEERSPEADCSFHVNGFQLRESRQCFRWVKLGLKEIVALITQLSIDWIFLHPGGVISPGVDLA